MTRFGQAGSLNQSCIWTRHPAASSATAAPPPVHHPLHRAAPVVALVVWWVLRYLLAPAPLEQLDLEIPEEQPPRNWTLLDGGQLGIAAAAIRAALEVHIRPGCRPPHADSSDYFRFPQVHYLEEGLPDVRLMALPDALDDALEVLRQATSIPIGILLNVTGNTSTLHTNPCALATELTETVVTLKIGSVLVCLIWTELNGQYRQLPRELKEEYFLMVAGTSVEKILEVARSFSGASWCACHVVHVLTIFDALVDVLYKLQSLPLNISDEVAGILGKMVDVFSGILGGTISDMDISEECAIHQATIVFKQILQFFCSNTHMVQSVLATIDPYSHMFDSWVRKLEGDAEKICQGQMDQVYTYMYLLNNAYDVWQMMRRPGASLSNVDLVSRIIMMIQRCRKSLFDECWVPLIAPLLTDDYLKNPRLSYLDKFGQGFDIIYSSQSTWRVTPELKYELRKEIKSLLVAPYACALQKKPSMVSRIGYWCKRFMQQRKIHSVFTLVQLENNIEELYES